MSKDDVETHDSISNTSLRFVENSFDEKESWVQDTVSKEILKSNFKERLNRKSNNMDENKMVKNDHRETERNVLDHMKK